MPSKNDLFYFELVSGFLGLCQAKWNEISCTNPVWLVKVGPHNRYLIRRENYNCEKRLFHLKSIYSFIFQAIFFKFSGNVPYIIRKKRYLWILIILKNKNFMKKIKKKKSFFSKKKYFYSKFFKVPSNVFLLLYKD